MILTIPSSMIIYEDIKEMTANARKYFMKLALKNTTDGECI
jgi:hypothetical protein